MPQSHEINSGPGWYEVISPRNATTCIALVYDDGSVYLPEGDDLTADEFHFAAACGNAHRLVRADEVQQEEAVNDDSCEQLTCRANQYASLSDTYDGQALCGCLNCIEYVADRESEDEV